MEENTQIAVIGNPLSAIVKSLPESKALDIINGTAVYVEGIQKYAQTADTLHITDPTDTKGMKLARETRLAVRDLRLKAKDYIDILRKSVQQRMADDKLEDSVLLKSLQTIELVSKNIESKLEFQEKFAERYQQETLARLREERGDILAPYASYVPFNSDLAALTEEGFEKVLHAGKLAKEDAERRERERLEREEAERKRKAEEAAEAARKQRELEAENARLRKEKEEAEKALRVEKAFRAADASAKQPTTQTITPSVEKVLIPLSEYKQLLKDAHFLECLNGAGVDNWQGIDYAFELHEEDFSQFLNEKLEALDKPLKR